MKLTSAVNATWAQWLLFEIKMVLYFAGYFLEMFASAQPSFSLFSLILAYIKNREHTKPNHLNNGHPNIHICIIKCECGSIYFWYFIETWPTSKSKWLQIWMAMWEIGPTKSHIQHNRMQISIIPFIRLFPFIDAGKHNPIQHPFSANPILHSLNQE